MPRLLALAAAGVAGAVTLTLMNELGRRVDRRAPRLDLLGERALALGLRRVGARRPGPRKLRRMALVGDLGLNTLYYAAVLAGAERPFTRGAIGGLLAGLAAAALAPALGRSRRLRDAQPLPALTVAWYAGAGLAASAVYRALSVEQLEQPTQRLPISRAIL